MISYCVSICLDVTCKSPYVIFKSKRIDLYWLVQYKSSLVIRLSNLRSWTSESFPDLSCYKNSLASENTFFLSFFLLIENYYSFASAEAILATFSFYDSKRSIGFVRFYFFPVFFVLLTSGISIGGASLEGVILFHASFRPHSICSRITLSLKQSAVKTNWRRKRIML